MLTCPASRADRLSPLSLGVLGPLLAAILLVIGSANVSATGPATDNSPLPVRKLPRDNLLLFHDEQGRVQPVRTLADWQRRRAEIMTNVQAIMGLLPGPEKRCPLDVKVEEEVDSGTYIRRRITYQSEPGGRVPAYLLLPKSLLNTPNARANAALCLHQTTDDGPASVVGLAGRPSLWYGQELAERGLVVLAPHYPLLGNYQPDLKSLGWESGTLKAVWDNTRGLDLLESLPEVKVESFAVIGHSLGGHNAVYTALFDDRLAAVVSSCGLDSYVDYYRGDPAVWEPGRGWNQTRYMPRLGEYRGRLDQIPFDFHEMIAALAPRTVFIVAPMRDGNFRPDSVDRIAAAARPVYELYGVPAKLRVEHPDEGHDFPAAMRQEAYRLIDAATRRPLP